MTSRLYSRSTRCCLLIPRRITKDVRRSKVLLYSVDMKGRKDDMWTGLTSIVRPSSVRLDARVISCVIQARSQYGLVKNCLHPNLTFRACFRHSWTVSFGVERSRECRMVQNYRKALSWPLRPSQTMTSSASEYICPMFATNVFFSSTLVWSMHIASIQKRMQWYFDRPTSKKSRILVRT